MKIKITKIILSFIITFVVVFRLPALPVFAYCPPYFAEISKIEPQIEGLDIKAGPGCGGELFITNNTGKDVVFFDENDKPVFKITPAGYYKTDCYLTPTASRLYESCSTDWQFISEQANNIHFQSPALTHLGRMNPDLEPKPWWKKQTVKSWTLNGKVGNTHFIVTGSTVYYPSHGTVIDRLIWLFFIIVPLCIFIAFFLIGRWIYRKVKAH